LGRKTAAKGMLINGTPGAGKTVYYKIEKFGGKGKAGKR
jgi:predicted PilT family ATPase